MVTGFIDHPSLNNGDKIRHRFAGDYDPRDCDPCIVLSTCANRPAKNRRNPVLYPGGSGISIAHTEGREIFTVFPCPAIT